MKVIGPQFDGLDDSQGTKLERKKMKTDEQKENEELIDRMLRRGVGGGKTLSYPFIIRIFNVFLWIDCYVLLVIVVRLSLIPN